MKVSEELKENVEKKIEYLKKKLKENGRSDEEIEADLKQLTDRYTIELKEVSGDILEEIKSYSFNGEIEDAFGNYICVEVPLTKVIEFLGKDYVKRAELERGVYVLKATGYTS